MNVSFAKDFIGCAVAVKAQFVGKGPGTATLPIDMTNKVILRVIPPGDSGRTEYAALPKEEADLVSQLNPGEVIRLIGGTNVTDPQSGPTQVTFMAARIERARR
jgi:hypothetical protein